MWLFRIYTQLEVSMNDVERVEEYTHELPTEDYDATELPPALRLRATFGAPPAAWPAEGAIEFCDVRLQYASAHRPIFDGLSFKVAPRTRVGVVGRTGAGKSSLTVALFRVVELGPPLELLGREHGAFRKLAEESGDLAALTEAAREAAGAE